MHSICWDPLTAAFDALDTALDRVVDLPLDALNTAERFTVLGRIEKLRCRLPAVEHDVINELARQATPAELGGKLPHALADRLHISRPEATRRIRDAEHLGARRSLTGEPLAPVLAATAAAQRSGALNTEHVRVIRDFWRRLPGFIDPATRETAEADLAGHGTGFGPEQLARLAEKIADALNPDGDFSDEDRARSRSLTLGPQDADGMSTLRGYLSPELRATLEAVLAKLAAPGMCNPDQPGPVISGTPGQEAIDSDTRSPAQRNHDGLLAGLRGLLSSGDLGQHNGLPASIIVTTTLAELEAAAGIARTGGGSRLPLTDLIRLGSHAHHYLAIFDGAKPLALHHTRRLASPAQRIMLYAKDRGCTRPGCSVPPYYCEVHHTVEYAKCRRTRIDELTLACGADHRLVDPDGWTTRINAAGEVEWLPPPRLDHGQPRVNHLNHPEKLLHTDAPAAGDDADDPG